MVHGGGPRYAEWVRRRAAAAGKAVGAVRVSDMARLCSMEDGYSQRGSGLSDYRSKLNYRAF